MYMKDNFIKELWVILRRHLSDDKIISKTKNPNRHKNLDKIEASMTEYWLNPSVSILKKEDEVSKYIERFLNSREIFDYKLDAFYNFYKELDDFLYKKDFRIEEIIDHQIYFRVESPTSIKNMEEALEQQAIEHSRWVKEMEEEERKRLLDTDYHYELRKEKAQKESILIATKNQWLLLEFMSASEVYMREITEYFKSQEVTIHNEKKFVRAILSIRKCYDKLSMGIPWLNKYNFDVIVPFRSLYSIEEDWYDSVKKDPEKTLFDFSNTTRNTNFNLDNIRSLLKPILKKMSLLIDDEIVNTTNNISSNELYITKADDDFKYNGKLLRLSKKTNYYKVFCALYALLPGGGEIEYKELIKEIKSRIPRTKSKSDEEMRKFIQGNLTEKGNGFIRYSKLPATMDNQRPIIETIRDFGIRFNNKTG